MANYMELVFILDKSGSMGGLENDTIGGYNSFLKKQQEEAGTTRITTVLFDNNYELLHDRLDIKAVCPITDKDYFVGGSTALLDAIGKSIHKVENVQKHSGDDYKPNKVLFVITTDGMENSSHEYTYDRVKSLVENKKEKGWEFIFLGANIDAIDVAGNFGISSRRAANYHADADGLETMFCKVSDVAVSYSLSEQSLIDDALIEKIKDEFEKRKKES